jgi:hypothetical protein
MSKFVKVSFKGGYLWVLHGVKGSTAQTQKDLLVRNCLSTAFALPGEDDPVHKLFTRGLTDQEKRLRS